MTQRYKKSAIKTKNRNIPYRNNRKTKKNSKITKKNITFNINM